MALASIFPNSPGLVVIDISENSCAETPIVKVAPSPLREAATWSVERIAAGVAAVVGKREVGNFAILMYHRVTETYPGKATPTYNVTPRHFRAQLAGLLSRGYEPWPLARLLVATRERLPIPKHVFAVTFDDGYENNLLNALPILRDLGIPATVFLTTGFLGSRNAFPSDVWSLAGSPEVPPTSWRLLTIDQCHELQDSGLIELGAHTHTHGNFKHNLPGFREDLNLSVGFLSETFGISSPSFAFPFGFATAEMIDVARASGVSCALSTRHECIRPGTDPFHWGRFNVRDSDTPATLAAKIDGWYTVVAGVARSIKAPLSAIPGL